MARTTCLHCGTRSYAIVDLGSLSRLFLAQAENCPCHGLRVLGKPWLGFCLLARSCEVDGHVPGYRERSGKPLLHPPTPHPPFFFFTIRSGSGAFSAMTWDLLRLHSFLLDLPIRFSLSSLRGTSSTRAPAEALRSTSGSRTDLSGENTDISQNTGHLTIQKTRGDDSLT